MEFDLDFCVYSNKFSGYVLKADILLTRWAIVVFELYGVRHGVRLIAFFFESNGCINKKQAVDAVKLGPFKDCFKAVARHVAHVCSCPWSRTECITLLFILDAGCNLLSITCDKYPDDYNKTSLIRLPTLPIYPCPVISPPQQRKNLLLPRPSALSILYSCDSCCCCGSAHIRLLFLFSGLQNLAQPLFGRDSSVGIAARYWMGGPGI